MRFSWLNPNLRCWCIFDIKFYNNYEQSKRATDGLIQFPGIDPDAQRIPERFYGKQSRRKAIGMGDYLDRKGRSDSQGIDREDNSIGWVLQPCEHNDKCLFAKEDFP